MSDLNSQKPNILAVDDFSMSLVLIKNALKDIATVYTVKSAAAAMLTIDNIGSIDLFLLDLDMPGINGFEFLEFLRRTPLYEKSPVIIISSNNKLKTIQKVLEYQIADFVAKPFDAETLREKVSKVFGIPYVKQIVEEE